METAAAVTALGIGAGAAGGVVAVGLLMAGQLLAYRVRKGPEWYEVKKAYMCSKAPKYTAQGCAVGACAGACVTDADVVAGAHASQAVPVGCAAGCLCMAGCHCMRLAYKMIKRRRRRQAVDEEDEEDDLEVEEEEVVPASSPPAKYENPLTTLHRKSRGVSERRDNALSALDEEWYEAELRRRRLNADLLRQGRLPEYQLRGTDVPDNVSDPVPHPRTSDVARKTRCIVADELSNDGSTHVADLAWRSSGGSSARSLGVGGTMW